MASVTSTLKHVRELRDWERKLQVPYVDWLDELQATQQFGMGAMHLRLLVVAGDVERAFNVLGEPGYNRESLERFVAWRASLPRWRKAVRFMFFWIRLA